MTKKRKTTGISTRSALQKHFGSLALENLVTATRTFPATARVDLQQALNRVFDQSYQADLIGVHSQYVHETLTVPHLLQDENYPVLIGPLQHNEIDIGDVLPTRCLKQGLWLASNQETRFAALLTPAERFGRSEGMHVEIAVPPGEEGLQLSRTFLDRVEKLVNEAGSYRGKVISLEATGSYSGKAGSVKVHRLRSVKRNEVILPEKTLKLLERNVTEFISQRERLRSLGMAIKKGLLFYGPPGTGKTHTIHYLASQLANHTTLLITAEQVGLLDEYFQLARFLQPAMVVIEDVDLIARAREEMRSACEESLLNRLLNEMDGLREDAAVLFVLTTNRPDQLEAALASRPGRIDQAIEFPLPDEAGRRKLIQLYSYGLSVPNDVAEAIVQKTTKASAAFIKELMRRCAQYLLQSGHDGGLSSDQMEAALDEMLFSGGSLNVKLLGGAIEN
ncbi:MAG TPA: ATP-binding protein [Chthoniobacterales bacterium]|nr:ATP-binding protein [Chthoniobacterales bacterium]